ncbi:unnamed protein product [Toxocara canis]|uniref:PIEZO domain-containing protein n=1 Tax=Toxocara canis TaxID=6265 RepID=A0A183TW26_TOXCA|nr:unnamed protein product [Toxocara canis]
MVTDAIPDAELQATEYSQEPSLLLTPDPLAGLGKANRTLLDNGVAEWNGTVIQPQPFTISDSWNRLSVTEPLHDDTERRIMEKGVTKSTKRNLMEQVYSMARSQSYVLMLFVMMAWSLLYHSWLTFVLMIVSCVVWMYPNSQGFCLKISPYIAIYAQALVLVQFLYGLDLTQAELPDEKPVFLRQIGFEKSRHSPPWRPILLKFVFTVLFWVTVKQRTIEARRNKEEHRKDVEQSVAVVDNQHEGRPPLQTAVTLSSSTVSYLRQLITKYWVVVNLCLLLAISLQNPVVIYRIIYMAFFQVFVNCFQAFFHNQSRLATMLGKYHKKHTGIFSVLKGAVSPRGDARKRVFAGKSDSSLKNDIKIRVEEPEEERNFPRVKEYMEKIGERCRSFADYHCLIVNYAWRFTEIHIDKAIAFTMLHICVQEISAMNIPYIIYIAVTLPRPKYTKKMSFIAGVWTSFVIVLKMIYQMEFIKEENLSVFCEDVYGVNGTVHAPAWVGLHKTTQVFTYSMNYILLTILLAFRSIVELRQSLHRYEHGEITPIRGILFNDITRKDADVDLCCCLKYLINFFFYRFGLEVCLMTAVVTIGLRSDMISVIYGAFLLVTLALTREKLARIWPYMTAGLTGSFVWQYILCVGIPKAFCQVYPWTNWDHNMIEWLFLPDFIIPPNPIKLYADFFLLLFVSLQLRVFHIEANERDYVGGSNESVVDRGRGHGRKALLKVKADEKVEVNNAGVPDFIGKSHTLLDRLKRIVFVYLYWLTLSMVFVAGTSRVTLFAFGYVVGCFIFLWVGNSLFLRPIRLALALLVVVDCAN